MNFCWFSLCLLLMVSQSTAIWCRFGRWCGRDTANAKDAINNGADPIFSLVMDTVTKAKEGITTTDLIQAAQQVKSASDDLIGQVSGEVVNNMLKEISKEIGATSAISAIFEDNITYDVKLLNDSIFIWKSLAQKGIEQKGTGESVEETLAAVSKMAQVIQSIVKDIVDVVKVSEGTKPSDSEKQDLLLVSGIDEKDQAQEVSRFKRRREICIVCIRFIGRICALCARWG